MITFLFEQKLWIWVFLYSSLRYCQQLLPSRVVRKKLLWVEIWYSWDARRLPSEIMNFQLSSEYIYIYIYAVPSIHMCVCVYIYICVCVYIYICVCVCVYIYIYIKHYVRAHEKVLGKKVKCARVHACTRKCTHTHTRYWYLSLSKTCPCNWIDRFQQSCQF